MLLSRALRPLSAFPLSAYALGRSVVFSGEYRVLRGLAALLKGGGTDDSPDPETLRWVREETIALYRREAELAIDGVLPWTTLLPEESLTRHLTRLPRLALDLLRIETRKRKGRTAVFDPGVREDNEGLPRYYLRNFHFQTNGYLSDDSAELYDHQVEMLFGGAGNAMRRLLLPPLLEFAARAREKKRLRILEVGAGTGSASRLLRLALPDARLTLLELSPAYLERARERLASHRGIDFIQGDAGDLPFREGTFDAVVSVFLHHELPEEVRAKTIAECSRVLRPGGLFGLVDSIQKGDFPQFDALLERFPRDFHEPFFRNYAERSLLPMLEAAGLPPPRVERGLLSKSLFAIKP